MNRTPSGGNTAIFVQLTKEKFHLIFLFQLNSSAQQQLKEIRKRPIRPAGRRVKATKPLEEMVSSDTSNSTIKQVIRKFSVNINKVLFLHKHISSGSIFGHKIR
jgi:hypothetical protein